MLKQLTDYAPIIRTWIGAIAFVHLTRPDLFDVRTKRMVADDIEKCMEMERVQIAYVTLNVSVTYICYLRF